MTGQPPGWPGPGPERPGTGRPGWRAPGAGRDAVAAALARERGRSRMRAATLVTGAASLLTAGVVALNLPGPARSHPVSATTPPAPPPSSPAVVYAGDDGGGDDGHAAQQPAAGQPATSRPGGSAHTTSGGS